MLTQTELERFEKWEAELNYCKFQRIKKAQGEKEHKEIKKNPFVYKKEFTFETIFLNHLKKSINILDLTNDFIEKEEEFEAQRNNYFKSY